MLKGMKLFWTFTWNKIFGTNSLLFAQLVQYFILNILKKDPPPSPAKKKKKTWS